MAHPSPRRKGWRGAVGATAVVAAAALAALPLAFLVSMLLTPLLWRLEPVVGMELAGHSGPSDWIVATIFGVFTVVLSVILLRSRRSS